MKTKGALLWGVKEEWSVEEIELGDPVAGEVQVQLAASGLCHSDEHLVTGATPVGFPAIGGHEGAGVVTKVGPGVTSLKEGDHVVLAFIPACGKCPPCSNGHQNLCDLGAFLLGGTAIADGTHRITARGQGVSPMCLLGTFSPYVTVHESSAVKIDDDHPLDKAALVGCGVTTGWGSATKVADTRPGETVVVIGIGGVGINAVQGARVAGARNIVAVDPVEMKQKAALDLGATHTAASMQEALPLVTELTVGQLADSVILTPGVLHGELLGQALALVGKGGTCVVTAIAPIAQANADINLFELAMWQKEVRGVIFGAGNPRFDIPNLLALYKSGQLKLDELITQTYTLDQINEGYQDMRDGKNIRGVLTFS